MSYKIPPSEPVAIVGSSCRFAGGVTSPSKLWSLLKEPTDLSRTIPSGRFNIGGFYNQDGEYHGTTNSPKGYFLEGNDSHRVFDTSFFNITPKEAEAIDPQQRMLLEAVYESLESAGYTLQQYSGEKVAVFAGIMTADYDTLSQRDDLTASQYYATGNARSIISNRLSYFYNFHGPSMTIDTACSSSLVALHQAVLSLRSGECVMACVTGANLMITPEQFIVESSLHMLSPSGHSRMWDAGADGYARGEGVACLLVKPLSRALADGDHIQAVVRETGVNSDGRTKGITMPNPEAQAMLIRDTYGRTGLDPREEGDRCQYFEAHGTGTHAGDPREAAAINEAFFGAAGTAGTAGTEENPGRLREGGEGREGRQSRQKLLVGSVKTVIGHTEGAAGLAGVLKVVQSMRNGMVPPNLHLETLNPSVRPFYSHLEIPTAVVPWPSPRPGHPLRASVNSFGFGGTNSHAIVEQYMPEIHDPVGRHFGGDPTTLRNPGDAAGGQQPAGQVPKMPLLLSANSQRSLLDMVSNYRSFIDAADEHSLELLRWSLYANRTALPFRLAISAGGGKEELVRAIDTVLKKGSQTSAAEVGTRGAALGRTKLKILGIFTGQGAQWATMSKGLLLRSEKFKSSIAKLDAVLQSCPDPPGWTLEGEILAEAESSRVNIAAVSQPLSTALQVALVDLLASLGVGFHTVVGHSSGEIAAAYAAGRLSARDAILVAYYRGLSAHLAGGAGGSKGGMIAAGLDRAEAEGLCESDGFRGRVGLAASNSPSSVTISGDLEGVHDVQRWLVEKGKFARVLVVDTAYHSHHMARPAGEYGDALAGCGIEPLAAEADAARWVSSVYGDDRVVGREELSSRYWIDNMTKPVLFREALEQAVRLMGGSSFDAAIEVGPHPQLKGPAAQTIKAVSGNGEKVVPYTGLLERKKEDSLAFSEFIGFMWTQFGPSAVRIGRPHVGTHGEDQEDAVQSTTSSSLLEEMPRYPWDHSQVHYRESRVSHQYHFRTSPPHELLGVRTRDDNEFEMRWRNVLRVETIPWLEHHRFQGQALLPASAYCVMALDAARVLLNGRAAVLVELEDVEFVGGITIEPGSYGVEVLFSLSVLPQSRERRHSHHHHHHHNSHHGSGTIEATFTVTSVATVADGSAPMRKNFQGGLRIVLGEPSAGALPARPAAHSETMSVSSDAFYQMMAGLDLGYTGPFRGLESIERRFNFASTTLLKRHPEDTTNLKVSPAMLDTCFQSCFSAFSAPGDRALWTSFLPRSISRLRFNLATCDSGAEPGQRAVVDAHLTDFKPMSREGAATITGDMAIYNEAGQMEMQVEGMTIGSFAATRPEDDYELYLHTVMQVDPEDEIVSMSAAGMDGDDDDAAADRSLAESCERVASFYLPRSQELTAAGPSPGLGSVATTMASSSPMVSRPWPAETEESLSSFILSSPFFVALDFLSTLGRNLPDVLQAMMPTVMFEARTLLRFQRHLAAVVGQIAHRYPRMKVLGVTDPELGLGEHVLAGLRSSFLSYTVASGRERNFNARVGTTGPVRGKVLFEDLDLDLGLEGNGDAGDGQDGAPAAATQQASSTEYDLVILSTSAMEARSSTATLKRIRRLMTPGGFLVLIHVSVRPLKDRLRRCAGYGSTGGGGSGDGDAGSLPTPPDWPDVLDSCGFARTGRGADQYYPPGFAVTVRQKESAEKAVLLRPLDSYDSKSNNSGSSSNGPDPPAKIIATEKLLVLGGLSETTKALTVSVGAHLAPLCGEVVTADSLDAADGEHLASCTAAVFLADLDEPALSTMTEGRLDALRALMRPGLAALWVTHGARDASPEHAASFGLARTLLAEIPSLRLQMLDLDVLKGEEDGNCGGTGRLIAETLARLLLGKSVAAGAGRLLWSHEPEVHIEGGRRLVPRVLPYRPGIERVNAARRVVSRPVNTVETPVEVVPSQSADGSARYETRLLDGGAVAAVLPRPGEALPSQMTVMVYYSSVDVLSLGAARDDSSASSSYVCVGRNLADGRAVAMLAGSNASFVRVPASLAHEIPAAMAGSPFFAACLLRFLAALSMAGRAGDRKVLLVEPDGLLFECAREVFFSQPWAGGPVMACTSDAAAFEGRQQRAAAAAGWVFVHPYSLPREVKAALFSAAGEADGGVSVFDFSPDGSEVSEMILDALPDNSEYNSRFSLLSSGRLVAVEESAGTDTLLVRAIEMATAKTLASTGEGLRLPERALTTVPSLVQGIPTSAAATNTPRPISSFQVLNWRAERTVPHVVSAGHPAEAGLLLRPYKTYLLVGITRDLGQSLCQLFAEHGARHIVLASRNPNMSPRWRDELAASSGVDVQIERCDVTDPEDVAALRRRVEGRMPPVGGVVNGAMVLEDRVFAQMGIDTLRRVMRPKTVGSANLDKVFCARDLEFFIMTSSFAAVGGHAGQGNYAAANMYMNGLAADRRRRGLAGSVLNIGVIYGLGFLHREKDNLYQGLEREGYPPVSERDIHHMFLEAIVAGRPAPGQVADLTTGLSRYRVDDPNQLHWHRDPRFSHYTVDDDDDDDGAATAADKASVRDRLEAAESPADVLAIVSAEMTAKLQSLLQLPTGAVSMDNSISELGVDSLMAVEIRSWIWKAVGKDVPVMKILGAASISKLCSDIADLITADRKAASDAAPPLTPEGSLTSDDVAAADGASSVDTRPSTMESLL